MIPDSHVCRAIAVLGTASDVGKSVVVTALCRIFRNAGIDVAPYKAQNMSNNSGVTPDGYEIGRAQIVQAEAAGVIPTADMNPILLKPNTDTGSQVVLQGRVECNQSAKGYFRDTSRWAALARESLERLKASHELLVIEGAGSCAEMNLYERDFVNFRTAREAGASVILVADIDRGGVFAQVVGTLAVIPPEDRALVKGVIINRFRGDIDLFKEGVAMLEERAGVPVLGVIPYFRGFAIESEDAVPLASKVDPKGRPAKGRTAVAAIYFPHISNFTDLAPLEEDPSLEVHYLHHPRPLDLYHMLVLPGSKNVRGDLDWLRNMGWERHIDEFRHRGGLIVGICGGYQMLGREIADPFGLEGEPGASEGLGLLAVMTTLEKKKCLTNACGEVDGFGIGVSGYEIHMGRTLAEASCRPFLKVYQRNGNPVDDVDGAVSIDDRVYGTYFHGLFDEAALRNWLLGLADPAYAPSGGGICRNDAYEMLARHFSENLDLERVFALAGTIREQMQ